MKSQDLRWQGGGEAMYLRKTGERSQATHTVSNSLGKLLLVSAEAQQT